MKKIFALFLSLSIIATTLIIIAHAGGIDLPIIEFDNNTKFIDVQTTDYFFDSVNWAVKNSITEGTTETTFSPEETCTRAQAVTFLWRANGKPKASNTTNPFADVAQGEYYYDAVLWATEEGITSGTSENTFEPETTVTREMFVTFLWRCEGEQWYNNENQFIDVFDSDYYFNAVKWAIKMEVTTGVDETHFGVGEACLRCQTVTFLYRFYDKKMIGDKNVFGSFAADKADDWNDLFDRSGNNNTWICADGIYSTPLNGDYSMGSGLTKGNKTLFSFSDTIVGTSLSNGQILSGYYMPNHSFAYYSNNNIEFEYGDVNNKNLLGENVWLADIYSDGDYAYIFGFTHDLIQWKVLEMYEYIVPIVDGKLDYAHLEKSKAIEGFSHWNLDKSTQWSFNFGLMPDGDYIYFYGQKDFLTIDGNSNEYICARVRKEDIRTFDSLEYYAGEDKWSDNVEDCAPILNNVMSEARVMKITSGKLAGKYICVYTDILDFKNIKIAIGTSPVSFDCGATIYKCSENGQVPEGGSGVLWSYNAKVHPTLSTDGKLLISYNVNVFMSNPVCSHDYHPRFIYLNY